MRTIALVAFTFAALLTLQGCAVTVVVAPNATFVGGDSTEDVGYQNNGRTAIHAEE